MPAVHFLVRWPNGQEEVCYSPSTVIKDHYEVGGTYSLEDFQVVSRLALKAASDRVQAVHGFPCSNALAQLTAIEQKIAHLKQTETGRVTFVGFQE